MWDIRMGRTKRGDRGSDGQICEREKKEDNGHEEPKTIANGVHLYDIGKSNITRNISNPGETLAFSLVPPVGRCLQRIN
jgi:hypothetical protein